MIYKLQKFKKILNEQDNVDLSLKLKDNLITVLLKAENPYLKEKRKRDQVYEALDLYLALETKVDFFTSDTINILSRSKIIPFILENKNLTSDMIVYAFFSKNFHRFSKYFKEVNFTKVKVKKYLGKKWSKPLIGQNLLKFKVFAYFRYLLYKFENFFFSNINPLNYFNKSNQTINTIKYSDELKEVLKKTIFKARFIYRTPIISSNILFLTLIEHKLSHSRELFIKLIPNIKSLVLLRYRVLSELYKTNVYITTMVTKSRLFYIFYGQMALDEQIFQNLIARPMRIQAYALRLRNNMIKKALRYSYSKYLKYLIYQDHHIKKLQIKSLIDKKTKKKLSFLDKIIYYTIKV